MKALVIDDEETILDLVQVCLEAGFSNAEVTRYPAADLGKPDASFDWSQFDILLLDHNLGNGETGVEWLREFGGLEGFPRTVLITAVTDPAVVAQALGSGAHSYLNKADLSPHRLVQTVADVLQNPRDGDATTIVEPDQHSDIARQFERERAAEAKGPLERYRIGRQIGEGAMSYVFIAERQRDGANVVLKILDRDLALDERMVQRFIQEAELMVAIDSPYVAAVYDHGFTHSFAYIAMEFFGRGDLKQCIEYGVHPDEAVIMLHNIAMGLDAIHSHNVVHRDLKPANIMIRADGSVAIADFGVAKDDSADLDLTVAGSLMGTPYYVSPEQIDGAPAGPQSDLYAAGIIFYEMLTGQRLFTGSNISSVLFQHTHAEPPALTGELARFNPILDGLLAKKPAK